MDFKRVELEDRELIDPYLKANPYGTCDFSFSNLIIWRRLYAVSYAIEDGFLILKSLKDRFLMPLGEGDLKEIMHKMIDYAKKNGHDFKMVGITLEMRDKLDFIMPGLLEYKCTPDSTDYIYRSEDLIELKGKKYHSKRNHVNRFIAENNFEYIKINEENLHEIKDMADRWYAQEDLTVEGSLLDEKYAVEDAITHFTALGLKGGAVKTDKGIVAFSMGQPLNKDVFDVNIEKAFYNVAGAYNIINQQFAKYECGDYKYINREEDLGVEGIRKAKLSYKPVNILDKCTARLKSAGEDKKI